MTYFPEQLTAGTRQFDAQIDFMRAMTAQAFVTAEQVLALNISASRETAVRAASTVRQLFSLNDPRDLFALGSQTQEQLSAMYSYGRELMNIATDARLNLIRQSAAIPSPAPEPAAPVPAPVEAAEVKPEQATEDIEPAGKVMAMADAKAPAEPRARAKPIAKAVGKATGKRAGSPHPSAAPLATAQGEDVDLPRLAPSEAAPVLDLKPPKSRRKK